MQIYFQRTGGFMGQSITRLVDTAVLPDEKAENLQTLVQQADFFGLPTDKTLPQPAFQNGDQFEYTLLIDDDHIHRRHTVKRCDDTVSDELWPLLRELTTLARSKDSQSIDHLPN